MAEEVTQMENEESIKQMMLDELKEKLESGEIDIDKYFHLKSLI